MCNMQGSHNQAHTFCVGTAEYGVSRVVFDSEWLSITKSAVFLVAAITIASWFDNSPLFLVSNALNALLQKWH